MFFHLCFALVFFSAESGYCQLFDLKNLAMTVADKALQGHTADTNYPIEKITIPSVQGYVNQVRAKLDPYSIHKQIPVCILKTSRIQGASIYGQEIDVTRGMLNMIEDEAELACLIGHEVGHADLNHQLQTYKRSIGDAILTTGALIAANSAGVGDVAADVDKNRQSIMAAAWSQSLEEEADQYGAVLAAKAGYNPYALCDLFDRLMIKVKASSVDQGIDLTSSHKSFEERSKNLKAYLGKNGYKVGEGVLGQKEFVKGIELIANIHTVEDLTNDQKKDIEDLKKIDDELATAATNGKKITPKRFLEIMSRYSQYIRKNHISRRQLLNSVGQNKADDSFSNNKSENSFMAATINQDSFFNPNSPNGLGPAGNFLVDGLGYAAKAAFGIAVPELGIAIGLYESASGKDLFTGADLTSDERLFSGLGALAGASFRGLSVLTDVEDTSTTPGMVKAMFDSTSATHDSVSSTAKEFNDLASNYSSGNNWQVQSYQNSTTLPASNNISSGSGQSATNSEMSAGDQALANANTDSLSFETTKDVNFYSVQTADENAGDSILVDFNPSKYTPSQLKNMLSLKSNPVGYSTVNVLKGTSMKASLINSGSKSGNVIGWKALGDENSVQIGKLVSFKN
jgi:Zn-dependent protease with chaperone function